MIAGIGNIYADEILHEARLRPDRMSDELGPAGERRLHAAIHRILTDAVAAGGSTLGDAQYVDLFGDGGSYQEAHKVYGRDRRALPHLRRRLDPTHRVAPSAPPTTAPVCQR